MVKGEGDLLMSCNHKSGRFFTLEYPEEVSTPFCGVSRCGAVLTRRLRCLVVSDVLHVVCFAFSSL